jgi:hypothetical protein
VAGAAGTEGLVGEGTVEICGEEWRLEIEAGCDKNDRAGV